MQLVPPVVLGGLSNGLERTINQEHNNGVRKGLMARPLARDTKTRSDCRSRTRLTGKAGRALYLCVTTARFNCKANYIAILMFTLLHMALINPNTDLKVRIMMSPPYKIINRKNIYINDTYQVSSF